MLSVLEVSVHVLPLELLMLGLGSGSFGSLCSRAAIGCLIVQGGIAGGGFEGKQFIPRKQGTANHLGTKQAALCCSSSAGYKAKLVRKHPENSSCKSKNSAVCIHALSTRVLEVTLKGPRPCVTLFSIYLVS